jgi:transcriptional regulator with XRE-family HTH domain
MTRLGALLWVKRQAAGKTLGDVSRCMKTYIRKIRDWEEGKESPTKKELQKLATFYDCDIEQLLGNELVPELEMWKVREILKERTLPSEF